MNDDELNALVEPFKGLPSQIDFPDLADEIRYRLESQVDLALGAEDIRVIGDRIRALTDLAQQGAIQ